MKTILALILTCISSFAATTYPVLTDNANRQFTGGATNLSLLNGTNVFTGTNRYTGTVVITNAASTISGNGAGITNIAAGNIASGSLSDARLSSNVPLLNGVNVFSGTNTFTASKIYGLQQILYYSSSPFTVTNLGTNISTANNSNYFAMPALVSSNAQILMTLYVSRTSLTTNALSMNTEAQFYIGQSAASATNMVHYPNLISSTNKRLVYSPTSVFALQGSLTNAVINTSVGGANIAYDSTSTNCVCTNVDFSLPWCIVMKVNDASAASTGTNTLTFHSFTISANVP